MGASFLGPFLQTLCCNSPWNYAVFWKLKHRDEMVLTWEDGFCDIPKPRDAMVSPVEDLHVKNSNMILSSTLTPSLLDGIPVNYRVGFVVAEMSRASHVVGKGVVGDAAFKGNARWIYSDSIQTDVLNSTLVSKYPDEWLLQFAAGIKTILLLPVIPYGVLQLGSMEMVAEDAALVAYVKNKFETHKESDGYIQQFSLISANMDNLEEPLTVTTENAIGDQNSIDAVRIEEHLIANQTVPVSPFQYLCNSSKRHVADNLEHVAEREVNLLPIHESDPSQLSNADHEDEFSKFCYEEKHRAFPHCYEFNTRMCGDFENEILDFQFEEDVTEQVFVGNYFDNAICEGEGYRFNVHGACELDKALESIMHDKTYEHISGTSISSQNIVFHSNGDREPSSTVDVSAVESAGPPAKEAEDHLFNIVVANAGSSVDEDSSDKSNVTSTNISFCRFSESHCKTKHSASVKEDRGFWNLTSAFIAPGLETTSSFTAPVSSVESKTCSLSDKHKKRKGFDTLNRGKLSRLSTTCKKRARTGDNQRPRPRDRQLIQDRIKELRELVPNSKKSSIDGLLDKTIKHMLFLRSVTDQADKLRQSILREEVEDNTTKPAEVNYNNQEGTSWAVELGSEQHLCPIIVKDLDHLGHMLIEVACTDHGRFLEITDVILRLKLTILKGVMEKATDSSSWARFIVETSGSFHRLDIFWPLMQLLQ